MMMIIEDNGARGNKLCIQNMRKIQKMPAIWTQIQKKLVQFFLGCSNQLSLFIININKTKREQNQNDKMNLQNHST